MNTAEKVEKFDELTETIDEESDLNTRLALAVGDVKDANSRKRGIEADLVKVRAKIRELRNLFKGQSFGPLFDRVAGQESKTPEQVIASQETERLIETEENIKKHFKERAHENISYGMMFKVSDDRASITLIKNVWYYPEFALGQSTTREITISADKAEGFLMGGDPASFETMESWYEEGIKVTQLATQEQLYLMFCYYLDLELSIVEGESDGKHKTLINWKDAHRHYTFPYDSEEMSKIEKFSPREKVEYYQRLAKDISTPAAEFGTMPASDDLVTVSVEDKTVFLTRGPIKRCLSGTQVIELFAQELTPQVLSQEQLQVWWVDAVAPNDGAVGIYDPDRVEAEYQESEAKLSSKRAKLNKKNKETVVGSSTDAIQ